MLQERDSNIDKEKPLLIEKFYDVHLGNLPTKVTSDDLWFLFSEAKDVRIHDTLSKTNYGFVSFSSVEEAKQACKKCHGTLMYSIPISVTLAQSTTDRIGGRNVVGMTRNVNGNSYRSISKRPREEYSKYVATQKDEQEIHLHLRKSLSTLNTNGDVQCFMEDFRETLVLMSKIPRGVTVDARKFEDSSRDLNGLCGLIVHYHSKPTDDYQPFKNVDFDLT